MNPFGAGADPVAAWFGLDRAAFTIDVHLGPWHVFLEGRAVFLLLVSVVIIGVAAVPVFLSGKAELRRRWTTWACILPIIGVPIWFGAGTTAALAAAIGIQAVREFSRLAALPKPETWILFALAVGYPVAAWLDPSLLALVPLIALLCAAPALLSADTTDGVRRGAMTAFVGTERV